MGVAPGAPPTPLEAAERRLALAWVICSATNTTAAWLFNSCLKTLQQQKLTEGIFGEGIAKGIFGGSSEDVEEQLNEMLEHQKVVCSVHNVAVPLPAPGSLVLVLEIQFERDWNSLDIQAAKSWVSVVAEIHVESGESATWTLQFLESHGHRQGEGLAPVHSLVPTALAAVRCATGGDKTATARWFREAVCTREGLY